MASPLITSQFPASPVHVDDGQNGLASSLNHNSLSSVCPCVREQRIVRQIVKPYRCICLDAHISSQSFLTHAVLTTSNPE